MQPTDNDPSQQSVEGAATGAVARTLLLRSFSSYLRVSVVALLALVSLIPLLIVGGVASEREGFYHQASREVATTWGRPQLLTGPVLVVPVDYVETPPDDGWRAANHKPIRTRKQLIVLPDDLQIDADVGYELRKRSIYNIALHSVDLQVKGIFDRPRSRIEAHLSSVAGFKTEVDWSAVRLVVGISDPRAIRLGAKDAVSQSSPPLQWDASVAELTPGAHEEILGPSIQAKVVIPAGSDDALFKLKLGLGTTQSFTVNALGGSTSYRLKSSWPHPSFMGAHSPVGRTINARGFSAQWEVHGLARSLPDIWIHEDQARILTNAQMGVKFHNPVTPYTSIDRGIKYGLLFIALTFLTFFCVELITGAKFHVVQYAVVSLGLIMFYMTLLAASEHLLFSWSYALATALITALLGAYTWGMTHERRITGLIVGVLLGLYGTLFVLLQLEDFALLTGTVLLLVTLAVLMYATRNLHRTPE